jgi:energy-coupling factor transporter transmembrane protein EcfT
VIYLGTGLSVYRSCIEHSIIIFIFILIILLLGASLGVLVIFVVVVFILILILILVASLQTVVVFKVLKGLDSGSEA